MNWALELTEGYSRLLEGSRIRLQVLEDPLEGELDVSPAGLARRTRPLEFRFQVAHGIESIRASRFRWELNPRCEVRCRILFSGNAFLGNFRVPEKHFAVEWDVEGEAEASADVERGLVGASAGSRMRHSWVELFPVEGSLKESLVSAWRSFVDPLSAVAIAQLRPSQVVRVTWTGRARIGIGLAWGWEKGAFIPSIGAWQLFTAGLESGAGATLRARVEVGGHFQLQVSRRSGRLTASLRRQRTRRMEAAASVGVKASSLLGVRNPGALLDGAGGIVGEAFGRPAVSHVNRTLRKALAKQVELSVTLSLEKNRRRSTLLRATWDDREPAGIAPGYALLLKGEFPDPAEGLKLTGSLEEARGRQVTVKVNILNWLSLRRVRQKEHWERIELTPDGEIVIEKGFSVKKEQEAWGEIQFLDLFLNSRQSVAGEETTLLLNRSWQGDCSFPELKERLLFGLRCGILSTFELPGGAEFPKKVTLLLRSRFDQDGLEQIRLAALDGSREGWVKALEIAWPANYAPRGPENFWRDWMESSELRREVEINPVQAHLSSRYPVPGRTETQRRAVVAAYRQVLRLTEVLRFWAAGDGERVRKMYEIGFGIPFFVWFHLNCPPALRTSGTMLSGELSRIWGEADLFSM